MRLPCLLLVLPFAACRPPPHYLVAEVRAPGAPLEDALVAADCGDALVATRRTDEDGRAQLQLRGRPEAGRCQLTVAHAGYATVERSGASTCTAPRACPPVAVWLEPTFARADVAPAGGAPAKVAR